MFQELKIFAFVCTYSVQVVFLDFAVLLLLLLLATAIELSLGGSSLYTSTDKTNKKKHT
jgi:hypothetical protein